MTAHERLSFEINDLWFIKICEISRLDSYKMVSSYRYLFVLYSKLINTNQNEPRFIRLEEIKKIIISLFIFTLNLLVIF